MTRIARGLSSTLMLIALPAAVAAAQSRKAQVLHPDPPPARGQLGGMAPSPAPRATSVDGERDHGYRGDGYDGRYRRHDDDDYRHDDHGDRGRYSNRIPTIVTNDGRVFANFGNGYEQVARACAAQYAQPANPSGSGVYSTPTYSLPNYGAQQPMPYTPPVPAMPTESQKMIQEQQAQANATQAAQIACWTTDAQGSVFVVGP